MTLINIILVGQEDKLSKEAVLMVLPERLIKVYKMNEREMILHKERKYLRQSDVLRTPQWSANPADRRWKVEGKLTPDKERTGKPC